MKERQQCEFFLVRYVPDPVKNEFVNVGVLLRPAGEAEKTLVRFTRDWSRVRCADPGVDIALLEALESELRGRLGKGGAHAQEVMAELEDWLSNSVQLTPGKACLAESLAAELEQLMAMYVETRKRPAAIRRGGRQSIHAAMRSQFERASVWDLMRKRIAAESYTRPGDPLRIDCGYRPNGVVRMFHAVSLEGDLETAKVLAFSMAAMRAGVKRVEGAELELTAIVEPLAAVRGGSRKAVQKAGQGGDDREHEQEDGDWTAQYRFAVDTMEQEAIRVLTTSDLPRVAEAARIDLRI